MRKLLLAVGGAALLMTAGVLARPYVEVEPLPAIEAHPVDVAALAADVEAMDLAPADEVWERIPWVRDLGEARSLSSETGRPIFLFSMWGELDSRC